MKKGKYLVKVENNYFKDTEDWGEERFKRGDIVTALLLAPIITLIYPIVLGMVLVGWLAARTSYIEVKK